METFLLRKALSMIEVEKKDFCRFFFGFRKYYDQSQGYIYTFALYSFTLKFDYEKVF